MFHSLRKSCPSMLWMLSRFIIADILQSLDVTLQTCVVHWLTVDPLEVEPAPRAMVSSAPSHGSVHELMPV